LKLWFLTTEYPPFYGGGIGTYMWHAARMFAGDGHEVTVFVSDQKNAEQQAEGIRVIRFRSGEDELAGGAYGPEPDDHEAFPFNVLSHWPALSYCFASKVREYIEQEGAPDFIEVQEYGGIGYYLLQQKWLGCKELTGVPVIVHLHTPTFEILDLDQFPSYRIPEYWVGRMERFSILAADARICPSHFLKDRVEETITGGRGNLDIHVINLPFKMSYENSVELDPKEKIIVYVGRLELRKGVLPLVESCHRLWEKGADFKLVMVGGDTDFYTKGISVGEYLRRRYERWVKEGRLKFTGNLAPDKCAQQVAQAWSVVIPSLYENHPLTCVEAMQAGKPVIASASGGQAEMVGDVDCGRVFDWNEKGGLERCIQEIINLSPREIKEMGQRARTRIRELTDYENVLPQRMEIFKKIQKDTVDKRFFPSNNRFDPWPEYLEPAAEVDSEPGLLSVAIPYYNMGDYIDETLQSALESTYRPLEVVIVNDGSTDPRSVEKLEEIEARGLESVRVVHQENQGLAAARNTGARNARGEFVAFLDADDLVAPDFYARCVDVLARYDNVSLVYSWVRYFDAAHGCFIANNLEFPYLLAHNMLAAICVLKRDDFLAFALNNPAMSYGLEDYESWISLYESGRLGVCIPEFLTSYRVRTNSMVRGMNDNQVLYMYDEIVRLHRDSYQKYGDDLFRLLNSNGASFAWNTPGDNWQSAEMRARCYEQEVLALREQADGWDCDVTRHFDYIPLGAIGIKGHFKGLVKGIRRKIKEYVKKFLGRK